MVFWGDKDRTYLLRQRVEPQCLMLDDNGMKLSLGDGTFIQLKDEGILLKKEKSQIKIGKGDTGEGLEMSELGTGSMTINKGKGVDLESGQDPFHISGGDRLEVSFGGDIEINANGNIDINAPLGEVRIKGKKIRLNE